MKILFILILIVWSVMRAMRKAQREQQRRAEVAAAKGPALSTEPSVTDQPDEFRRASRRIRSVNPVEPSGNEQTTNDEPVVELLQPVDEPSADAYSQTNVAASTGITFDKQSLRTFFVTREILGAPRFRSPFRPGIRK